MSQLETDIKHAINIIKYPDDNHGIPQEYSRVYANTTERINAYMPHLIGNHNNALLATASGDQLLESLLYGIDSFTCFDINRLARYFTELKFEAIRNLSRKEYIHFMYEDLFHQKYYNYFKYSLDDDVLIFWNEIFKNCDIEDITANFFVSIRDKDKLQCANDIDFYKHSATQYTSHLQEDNYKLIQDRLQAANIKYLESDLLQLPKQLNETYDFINLTNIYEFINKTIIGNGVSDFANVIRELIPYLNKNGTLLITYLYKCSNEDIEKYSKKSISYIKFLVSLIYNQKINSHYEKYAIKHNKKTLLDILYAYRNVQILRYLNDLNIDTYEFEETGIGLGRGNKDMTLSYKK